MSEAPLTSWPQKDARLDCAIAEVMKRLEASPPKWPPLPPSRDLTNPQVPK